MTDSARSAAIDLPGVDTDGVWGSRWSAQLARRVAGGGVSLSVAQPLRAETGELRFLAPTDVDDRGALVFSEIGAALSPSGRQVDYELRYNFSLPGGWRGQASTALSTTPNHIAGSDDETAAWLSFRKTW